MLSRSAICVIKVFLQTVRVLLLIILLSQAWPRKEKNQNLGEISQPTHAPTKVELLKGDLFMSWITTWIK